MFKFAHMKRINCCLLLLFLFIADTFSQSVFFENRYGTSRIEVSETVKQLPSGSIFMVGYSDSLSANANYNPTLSKFDKFGNWLWTQHFTSPEIDVCYYLTILKDGSILMVGDVNTNGPTGIDALFIKTDTLGNLKWKKTWGGAYSESIEYIDTTSDGNFIVCGYQYSPNHNNDALIMKIDSGANVLWYKTHGGAQVDYSDYVRQTKDGGYISSAVTSSFGAGNTDAMILKLNQYGDTLWTRTSGDANSGGCQGVWPCANGDFLLYGEEEISAGNWFNFFMTRYDSVGNFLWKKNFGGSGSDAIFDVIETSDKGFLCTGYSDSYSVGALNLIFFKTDSAGKVLWRRVYGNQGVDIGLNINKSIDGGFLITGQTTYPDDQYYLLHIDSLGMLSSISESTVSGFYFSLFPNPTAKKSINVFVPDLKEKVLYQILNIEGEIITQGYLASESMTEISFPELLTPGMYFIKLKSDSKFSNRRFIILSN